MEKDGHIKLKVEKKDLPHNNIVKKKSKDEENLDEEDELTQEGMALICIMCRDGEGKSDGVMNLRRMYNKEKWDAHTAGEKIRII